MLILVASLFFISCALTGDNGSREFGEEQIQSTEIQKHSAAAGKVEVVYTVTGEWNGGFSASVTITNNSDKVVNGWTVTWTFDSPSQTVTSGWNGVFTVKGNSVSVKNSAHNGRIAPGKSASFGFTGKQNGENKVPSDLTFSTYKPDPTVPKLCALTFDDGPDAKKTALMLDKLEKYKVPASFFLVGKQINASTAGVIKRAIALGCDIHNHSWSHGYMTNLSKEDITKEIEDTSAAIKKYCGATAAFFRPPYLATNKTMYEAIDLPFISGIAAHDWEPSTTDRQRADYVLAKMKDGAIILLHDVQPHKTDGTLDILIPELKKQGYSFVTITDLFEKKGVDPHSKKEGTWTYVE